jgi:hypothetical protein
MNNLETELADNDERVAKKWKKRINLGIKCKSNMNRIIEELSACGNVDNANFSVILDM